LGRLEGAAGYPPLSAAPYAPGEAYPEFPELSAGSVPNPVFALVRGALRDLGLDAGRFGTAEWNPLGDLVKPGGKIVVKPNWVLHRNEGAGGMECMITHPSVLRAVLDYVFLAQPSEVVLGDAPLQGCDFDKLLDFGGLRQVVADFQARGLPLAVRDFRRTVMREKGNLKFVDEELRPESEYVLVDLGADSLLEPISKDWKKFRVTVYDPRKMRPHHQPGRHRYLIAREIPEADLVVNVPKLKAHKKAGITCCLKNLVGINGNKEYLPHHRKGAADSGAGDDYAHAHWKLSLAETCWISRMATCANGRICTGDGTRRLAIDGQAKPGGSHRPDRGELARERHGLAHVPGPEPGVAVCRGGRAHARRDAAGGDFHRGCGGGGAGRGPLAPDPLATGAVFAVRNPAVGDYLGAALLGFDPGRIPLLQHACSDMRWRICAAPPPPRFGMRCFRPPGHRKAGRGISSPGYRLCCLWGGRAARRSCLTAGEGGVS
jgi:uncharacterized protein (DUF362 family)